MEIKEKGYSQVYTNYVMINSITVKDNHSKMNQISQT